MKGSKTLLLVLILAHCFGSKALEAGMPCRVSPLARRTVVYSCKSLRDNAPDNAPVAVAFFDADSTLRVSRSGAPCANHYLDVILLPMVAPRIRALAHEGYLIAIVSNQGGVSRGYLSLERAEAGLRRTCELLNRAGAPVHYFDFAEDYDAFRKPRVAMARLLNQLLEKRLGRGIDWSRSFMVGDSAWKRGVDQEPDGTPGRDFSNSDRFFAKNVRENLGSGEGMVFHHPRNFFGWVDYGVFNFHSLSELREFLEDRREFAPGVNALGFTSR